MTTLAEMIQWSLNSPDKIAKAVGCEECKWADQKAIEEERSCCMHPDQVMAVEMGGDDYAAFCQSKEISTECSTTLNKEDNNEDNK